MSGAGRHLEEVAAYYATHPIHEAQILEHLRRRGLDPARITEEELKEHDQDHFGGLEAVDRLADLAGIDDRCHVLDVCSGLGGPARYLAHRRGCRVTGIDLTRSRHESAIRLTALVGLADRVTFVHGSALELPFPDRAFDVVIGEEAWAHVPDKPRLIAEVVRVTRPGGRIAFTDIVARQPLDAITRCRLERGMTFIDLATIEGYTALLEGRGCEVVHAEDLSPLWTRILVDRLAMYRSLRDTTIASLGEDRFLSWDAIYSYFVEQFRRGVLGGARLVARVP